MEACLPALSKVLHLGRGATGLAYRALENAVKYTGDRLTAVVQALNETLYKEFGQHRIDSNRAFDAFNGLLRLVQQHNVDVMAATTNYDRSLDSAFRKIGMRVETGFESGGDTRPRMNAQGLVARARIASRGTCVPVLHLHGAVGWYESNGGVYDYFGDGPFNSSLGTPVVLYPDPAKDPTRDAIVSQLWSELQEALDWATHILVLGHSLHDPPLVDAISAASTKTRTAVSYIDEEGRKTIGQRLPSAVPIKLEFGPDLDVAAEQLSHWVDS